MTNSRQHCGVVGALLLCGAGCAAAPLPQIAEKAPVQTVAHAQIVPTETTDTRLNEISPLPKIGRWGGFTYENENISFPAGDDVVLNVRDFGAKGDGKTDDTAAFQKALVEATSGKPNLIYVPNGTYLITDTLKWAGRQTRTVMQGQSERGVKIQLPDRTFGFTDATAPKEMIWTGDFPPQRFRNAIRNLTIDTGKNNPGAIGLRFNASNQGILREVTIQSGDGQGTVGLDMGYTGDVGPLMVKNLTVKGFDVGIYTAYGSAGQVFEGVTLENQNYYGWINDGQAISIRALQSKNAVPVMFNKVLSGFVTILDSSFVGSGEAKNVAAITNNSGMLVRNLQTTGYQSAIDGSSGTGRSVVGPNVGEFTSSPPKALFASTGKTLGLPVQETPDVPLDDPKTWKSVLDYQPKEGIVESADQSRNASRLVKNPKIFQLKIWDYTDAIQQAIDSGATTIYFPKAPKGKPYAVAGKIHVRGKVRRIIGLENSFEDNFKGIASFGGQWIIEDGTAPTLVVERFDWIYGNPLFRIRTKRNVVFASIPGGRYDIGEGANVFFEDVVSAIEAHKGSHVWIRQFNTEYTNETRHFIDDEGWRVPAPGMPEESRGNTNDGGTLWAMGIKSEGDGTIISTFDGGKTEVLGGLIYANKADNPNKKMFVVENGELSFSIKEQVGRNQPFNPVVETRDGQTKLIPVGSNASMIPLYTSAPGPIKPVEDKPQIAESPAGSGTGLKAEYLIDNRMLEVKTTQTDAQVSFDWSKGAPAGLNAKNFGVRWSGFIEPRKSGVYQFPLSSDGMRLMIGDKVVNTSWPGGGRYRNGSTVLEAGRKYPIRFEARATSQVALGKVELTWQPPGEKAEAVPTTQLYPATQSVPTVSITSPRGDAPEGATVEITLQRDGNLSQPLTVNLAPRVEARMPLKIDWGRRGGTLPGVDYEPIPESFTFKAGQKEIKVPIKLLDDDKPEPDKWVGYELDFEPTYNAAGGVKLYIKDNDTPTPGKGTGLPTEYFDDQELKQSKGKRVDDNLIFNWDKAAPMPGIETQTGDKGPHGFSARWSGFIEPQFSETYKFTVLTGQYGAARLKIGDTILLDSWDGKSFDTSGSIALEKGKKYPVTLEYKATNFYGANMMFLWSSASQFEQIVPGTQLYPAP